MIDNYKIHEEYGVLTQVQREPFAYTENYVDAYNALDCEAMSRVRYNNIITSIGYIPLSILDVGYGNGAFLKYCIDEEVECYGYDVAPTDTPKGSKKLYDLSYIEYVDVITFFDAIEHTSDIELTIKSLPKHSHIVISVPACREYIGSKKQFTDEWFSGWKHKKDNEHIWHFSPASLILFMTANGYSIVSLNNCEDAIRKSNESPNIITGIFKKG